MNTKENIIQYLVEHRGEICSGQKIADEFNITRNAVWNNIEKLIEDGVPIKKVKNKGYILEDNIDIETEKDIKQNLNKEISLILLDEVDSTNKYAQEKLLTTATKTLIVARKQTNGIGRRNRVFESPKYNGIYMSYIYDKYFNINDLALLTILSVNSIHQVFKEYNIELQIKYLNDLYYNNKKVSGILTEANIDVEDNLIKDIIIGIGINLYNTKDFTNTLLNKIGIIENSNNIKKSKLIAQIINKLDSKLQNYDFNTELNYYKKYNFLIGKVVSLTTENKTYSALIEDIDNNFNLIVNINNEQKKYHFNQISISLDDLNS